MPTRKEYQKHALLKEVSYDCLLEMCFWGSKILHDRSVALAHKTSLPLQIRSSESSEKGTLVTQETHMYESHEILSVNSHESVHRYTLDSPSLDKAMGLLKDVIQTHNLPWPQVLQTEEIDSKAHMLLAGEPEELHALSEAIKTDENIHLKDSSLATVTVTAYGGVKSNFLQQSLQNLAKESIQVHETILSPLSLTFVVRREQVTNTLRILHQRTVATS